MKKTVDGVKTSLVVGELYEIENGENGTEVEPLLIKRKLPTKEELLNELVVDMKVVMAERVGQKFSRGEIGRREFEIGKFVWEDGETQDIEVARVNVKVTAEGIVVVGEGEETDVENKMVTLERNFYIEVKTI